MLQSPEMQAKIQEWRQRAERGEMTIPDWIEAFRTLRQSRASAQTASAASKTRKAASKAPVDTAALKANLLAGLKKP